MSGEAGFAAYVDFAGPRLRSFAEAAVSSFQDGQIEVGRWHPFGFAVFTLRTLSDESTLRLHIWPVGLRRSRPGHPRVHAHDWHLVSLILAGEYRDQRLVDPRSRAPGRIVTADVYNVLPSGAGADVFARRIGETVRGRVGPVRKFGPGQAHSIPAGDYHVSPIPASSFAATLVLTSAPVSPDMRRLAVQTPMPSGLRYERPVVSSTEVATLRRQLRARRP